MNTYKFRAKIKGKGGVTGSMDGELTNVPDGQTIEQLMTMALGTIHKTLPTAEVVRMSVTKVKDRARQFCASLPKP